MDLGVVQLLDRQSDTDARERSTRAYRGIGRAAHTANTSPQSSAPVALELSNAAHPVEAFANFADASAHERVHVRLVDAVTTRTLGEITVGSDVASQPAGDDYRHLIAPWSTRSPFS
jgi:hypothetical protein